MLDKKKIEKEFEEDKEDIKTVFTAKKEVNSAVINKHGETMVSKKKLVNARGEELVSFYGRTLIREKRLHGSDYVAKAGMKYDDIDSSFKLKVTFTEDDF